MPNKKQYKIPSDQIVRLVNHNGGCLATDRITVEGEGVGYMYRESTERAEDTGWRFFAGDEDEEYMSNNDHHGVYAVNTIANYSPEILDYLSAPNGSAFERIPNTNQFKEVRD